MPSTLDHFRTIVSYDVRTWKNAMLDLREKHGLEPRIWCNSSGVYISQRKLITVDHIDPKFRDFVQQFLEVKQLTFNTLTPIVCRHRGFSIVPTVQFEHPHQGIADDFRDWHWKKYRMEQICDPHPCLRLMSRRDNAKLG